MKRLVFVCLTFSIYLCISTVARAECWRLASGQIVVTNSGSTAPTGSAQKVQCPVQAQTNSQQTQKAAQQEQQRQQQLAQQQAQQSQQAAQIKAQQEQQRQQQLAQQQAQQAQQAAQIKAQQEQQRQQQLAQQQTQPSAPQKATQNGVTIGSTSALPPNNTAMSTPSTITAAPSGAGRSIVSALTSNMPKTKTSCGSKEWQKNLLQVEEYLQVLSSGTSFEAVCEGHDRCYAAQNCNVTKNYCDQILLRDALALCSSKSNAMQRATCNKTAQIFYDRVVNNGGSPFATARAELKCSR